MPRSSRSTRIGLALLAAVSLCLGAGGPPIWAGEAPGAKPSLADLPVETIEQIIRDYLLRNPEVIREAMQALEVKQRAAEAERVKGVIVQRREEIQRHPDSPVGGNPDGDVTVVEFFDYRCPYCRTVAPTLATVAGEDPKLRVVYKEFPILGPPSVLAARAALASREQGKYLALHRALMAAEGDFTEARLLEIAASVGLDTARLRKDMEDPKIIATIQRNYALARSLGINGTPSFVVGDELVVGELNAAALKLKIARARSR